MISLSVEGSRLRIEIDDDQPEKRTKMQRIFESRFPTVAQERNPLHVRRINQCTCASYMKLAVDTRVAVKGIQFRHKVSPEVSPIDAANIADGYPALVTLRAILSVKLFEVNRLHINTEASDHYRS
jgi:hypothetical protein